eukprot:gene28796-31984_t
MNMMMKTNASGLMKTAARPNVVAKATGGGRVQDTRTYLESLPGITAPFGEIFDPANLAATASVADVRRWRESEVTHGRVAMLASLGFVIGEQLEDFPAFMNFDGSITGPAIYQFQQVRQGFWEPLLICIGLAETYRVSAGWATPTGNGFNALKDEYNPGELNFDPLGICPTDPEELKVMQTKELNNGRLAMIAIAGFTVQELVDGQEIFEHLFVGAADEVVKELDDIERDLGISETPVPFPGF